MAIIITGVIMGKRINDEINCFPLNFSLPRTRAAGTPNNTERKLVIMPILKLFSIDVTHSSVSKKFLYHWRENPLGGNSRYGEELKEIGKMIKSGAKRNNKMDPHRV